jgi:hypothetical protein
MGIPLTVLDSITIASPCTVPWDNMQGNDRTRFCTKCSQKVHDISEMTTAEAMQLLTGAEKLPCLRIHRRADGRVMTADCPTTRRNRVWRWLGRRSSWAASLFAIVFLAGCEKRPPNVTAGIPCRALYEQEGIPPPREVLPHMAPMPHAAGAEKTATEAKD